MDRDDTLAEFRDLDPSTASAEALRSMLGALKALPPVYLLVGYRPDAVDTCRGCEMGRSGSDHVVTDSEDPEEIARAWARLIDFPSAQSTPRNFADYDVNLYCDGRNTEWADDPAIEAAAARIKVRAEELAAGLAAERKRRRDAEAARAAAQERARKDESERRLLRELLDKHGAPADQT